MDAYCLFSPRKLAATSVQFSRSVVSDSLRPHGLKHTRLRCPSTTCGVCSNSYPSSRWCHPNISSSDVPFSSCLQSFPASGSFPVSQFFTSGGQSIGVSASASVLPMNIQDWLPLGWTPYLFYLLVHLLLTTKVATYLPIISRQTKMKELLCKLKIGSPILYL